LARRWAAIPSAIISEVIFAVGGTFCAAFGGALSGLPAGAVALVGARVGTLEFSVALCGGFGHALLSGLAGLFGQHVGRFEAAGFELAGSGEAQSFDFFGSQFAKLAGLDIENKRAVADAANLLDVVTDLFEHLAQFAVAAFDEDDFVPGIFTGAQLLDAGGRCADFALPRLAALDGDSVAEALDHLVAGLPGDFDEISFFDAVRSLGEGVGEFAVVGDEEQTFALEVESADGIEALTELGEELHDGGAAFGVGNRGDVAARLVEQKVAMALGAVEKLAIDADVIARGVGFGAEDRDNLAIDLDAALGDELFGVAAAGDAGLGEDLLEAIEVGRRHRLGCEFGLGVGGVFDCGFGFFG